MIRSSHSLRTACARWAALVAVAAVVVAMAVWLEPPATATERVGPAPFTVTNLADSGASVWDGLVVDETGDVDDGDYSSGHLSLREAIKVANATSEADTITFAPNVTGTIGLTSGEIEITTNVTIQGPGATILTISGNNAFRVFLINSGGSLTISGLTISNGNASGAGGGIWNNGGSLTLTDSTLSNNSATDGSGIFNFGTATITNSTLSNNTATSGGGGIFNGRKLTLTNSTLSVNSSAQGGGIYNGGGSTAKISNSTLSNNTVLNVFNGGGVFVAFLSTVTIKNSIVANSPIGGNCRVSGTLNSEGVNLATDSTCAGFTQVTKEQLNLGPPKLNSPGTNSTHALLPGSAAIDAVEDCTDVDSNPVTTDQRGVTRPQGPACDVGAFEVEAATPEGMIEALVETIEDFDPPLHHGTANSLLAKLNNALAALQAGNTNAASNILAAFINQVEEQAGKSINQAQAAELIATASQILTTL